MKMDYLAGPKGWSFGEPTQPDSLISELKK